MKFAKILATVFGIGYFPWGPGTLAALVASIFFYSIYVVPWGQLFSPFAVVVVFFIGVWVSNIVEKDWGKDSSLVVIDEVLGMGVSLLFIPADWHYYLVAFILFRIFDIGKPLLIRRMESFPAGWGVMLDDLLAGIYANIVLQVIIRI